MKTQEQITEELKAPFPEDQISWRIQGKPFERDGKYFGLALAYIDARDVMNRLDDVVGSDNWTDTYQDTQKRTYCTLGIDFNGNLEWTYKSDAAGDSDIESEKGAVSDAFKRAAVKFGVGRYLYDLDSPWVECEVKEWEGKKQWKKWIGDPWKEVKKKPQSLTQHGFSNLVTRNEMAELLDFAVTRSGNLAELESLKPYFNRLSKTDNQLKTDLVTKYNTAFQALKEIEQE